MRYFLLLITVQSFFGQITLDDIWVDYKFYPKAVQPPKWNTRETYLELQNINSLSPNIYEIKANDLSIINTVLKQGHYEEFLKKTFKKSKGLRLEDFTVNDFSLSADKNHLLLYTGQENVYRHSKKSNFILFNINTKSFTRINLPSKGFYPAFSHDGKQIAFVCKNNIWVYSIQKNQSTQLTTDGSLNTIINGKSDWAYEEEFELTQAFKWSTNDEQIVYLQFDESQVKTYTMQLWGDSNHPINYAYKYPKTGENISGVKVKQVTVKTGQSKILKDFTNAEVYIPRLEIVREEIIITTINRQQNKLEIIALSTDKPKKGKTIYKESSATYIELKTPTLYFDNGFVITNETSGYRHLYFYNYNGKQIKQLTQGKWEVDKVFGANKKGIYFSSTQRSIFERPVSRVSLEGVQKTIIDAKGVNEVTINSDTDYLFSKNSSISIPTNYSFIDSEGGFVNKIESNANVYYETKNYTLPTPEYFTYENSNGDTLNAYLLKPKKFDSTFKYPVIVHTYGGPGYQSLLDEYNPFDFYWHSMLTQSDIMVVVIDARGTGGKGASFRNCTYGQLGKLESDDLIEFGEHLKMMPFVNNSKMALWGWSYGGFLSALTAFKSETFNVAISVAPVTSWLYYDAIYTERYMNLMDNNKEGYIENTPMNYVSNFNGHLLLVHGTADDNVHIQNNYSLQNVLIEEGIQFDFGLYPDRNHGIYGGNTRRHLYQKMTNFLLEHLK